MERLRLREIFVIIKLKCFNLEANSMFLRFATQRG